MSKHEFQTEVSDLLQLMIHSLYSNKEIFLRELISNASDALDKLNYLCLTDEAYKSFNYTPKIEISLDKEKKILRISDTGIGMDENDLINNLGTIAKSGTKSFVASLSGDAKKDSNLIGQFGVGFYSAFMVAERVEVRSKKALTQKAYLWQSDTKDFSVSECDKDEYGTEITLFLNNDDFLSEYTLESIVKKYSNHVPYAIFLQKEVADDSQKNSDENAPKEPKFHTQMVQINSVSAIWRMPKSSLKDSDYNEFYKQISHDSNDPMLHIHTKAEGSIEYATLFFIPSVAPLDMYRMDYESGVKLYVKRVFITDDNKELLPSYLRFVRGIIDVEDLPLNVSREILQDNRILRTVKDASAKKILSELANLMQKDREKYMKFYKIFGKVLKEGLYGFSPYRDELLGLCMFKSSQKGDFVSLKEYKEAMNTKQKAIFYISGNDENVLKNSPLIESYKAQNIDVLLCDDEIDSVILPFVGEFDGVKFENIANSESDEVKDESFDEILAKIKEVLSDEVKNVRLSSRLGDFASCLVYDKNDPDYATQELFRQMGQQVPDIKPILEINANSEIATKLKANPQNVGEVAQILLNLARISEGIAPKDPAKFAKILNNYIAKAL